jgi:hypothetical protein
MFARALIHGFPFGGLWHWQRANAWRGGAQGTLNGGDPRGAIVRRVCVVVASATICTSVSGGVSAVVIQAEGSFQGFGLAGQKLQGLTWEIV